MREVIIPFLSWYLVTQIVTAAALPLTLHYFRNLPDRGYAFARILGILLVSLLLWLCTSYGLLRNTLGGALLALLLLALLSLWAALAQQSGGEAANSGRASDAGVSRLSRLRGAIFGPLPPWRYRLSVELLFFLAFAAWTWVRAYDPAISHTEQPMDLMFMNGIWSSASYPPRDPWLAGYAISYYYFGYWMVVTLARIAGQPPEIAYNIGQACWFGLLVTGSFGLGYNLLRLRAQEEADDAPLASDAGIRPDRSRFAVVAGLLTAVAVALTGNLQVILEWLYAQGARLDGLIRWVDVYNFPEYAQVSHLWYIDSGWSWWWRASRVIEDLDLSGNHIEIIDEFPIFSYVLGDNHPHVLAMPFVLLAIALALNWFSGEARTGREADAEAASGSANFLNACLSHLRSLSDALPFGAAGFLLLIAAAGALVFLNTWDFPPYWLLLLLAALYSGARQGGLAAGLWRGGIGAGLLLLGTLLLYLPYFLTAQSQAGGILPNLLHPTRLPQFLLMFGHFLLAVVGLLLLAWREQRPSAAAVAAATAVALGLPIIFLLLSGLQATGGIGAALPSGEVSGEIIVQRRLAHPWTFLLMGGLSSLTLALLWQRLVEPGKASRATTFVLLLVAIGALLTYAPEFVYLRDNFGNRMNTIFKFHYQGWLLLGISAAYAIAGSGWQAMRGLTMSKSAGQRTDEREARAPHSSPIFARGIRSGLPILSALSLLLILACLIYPVAGAYAKIKGFGTQQPTLNGIAYVGADERAAIDWIRRNTAPDAIILEAKGTSYQISSARLSAATGRATLLGWDGHESQWRGRAYGEMAAGRAEAVREIYERPTPSTLPQLLDRWQIDYVLVGPQERANYGVTSELERRLGQIMDVAFEQGSYRIFSSRPTAAVRAFGIDETRASGSADGELP